MCKHTERRRQQLTILHRHQEGLCCHCHEPMDLDFGHVGDPFGVVHFNHATIEHTLPKTLKGPNEFCNFLAAHADCNNNRHHEYPSDELIEFHMMIHQRIIDADEYPKFSRLATLEQFVRPEDMVEYQTMHRDTEAVSSPFEALRLLVDKTPE